MGYYPDGPIVDARERKLIDGRVPLCLERLISKGDVPEANGRKGELATGVKRQRKKRRRRRKGAEKGALEVMRELGCTTQEEKEEMGFNVDEESCSTSDEAQEEEGSEKSGMASSITGEEEEIGEDDFGSMGNEGCPMQVMEEEEQEDAGSKRGWWLFDTVNANAWGSEETQGRGKGALDYLRRTNADVVGIQETRVTTKEKCATGMGAAKKAKWKTKLVEADVTCKGYSSAGVAVACRSHFGMTDPHVDGIEYDRARIAHGHIGAVCRGGIHCFSVYLHTCEGMTGRKRALLLELSRLVKAVRGPWVVMGDWNLTPDALEAVGWAEEVKGKIVCVRGCRRARGL